MSRKRKGKPGRPRPPRNKNHIVRYKYGYVDVGMLGGILKQYYEPNIAEWLNDELLHSKALTMFGEHDTV